MGQRADQILQPSKGWVRDGILSLLAKGPATATEVANKLGVSKATVSYHTKALIRRDIIEISDIQSIRGGVYSKTYSLRGAGPPLAGRRGEQEGALSHLDEIFEKMMMTWHLEPKRMPSDEIEVFLYHLFRILTEADSLDRASLNEFGQRVGNLMISPALNVPTMKRGLRELADYLSTEGMAEVSAEVEKGQEARLVCMGCFENRNYGGLVCSFTEGMLTGAIRAKHGGRPQLERLKRAEGEPGCAFVVKVRGSRS